MTTETVVAGLDPGGWTRGNLPGLTEKVLWRRGEGDASITLLRFERGAGVPGAHRHPSNQFMYCLSGSYTYESSGIVLGPGSFYWNPLGNEHGPTEALEPTLLLEIYDGRHYDEEPGPLDRVGTSLLHSNELVNVWDVTLEPGQSVPWHRHRYPYVVVTVEASRAAITDRSSGEVRTADGTAGSVVYDPGGVVHTLKNVGSAVLRDRLIEFKTPGARPPRVHIKAPEGEEAE